MSLIKVHKIKKVEETVHYV